MAKRKRSSSGVVATAIATALVLSAYAYAHHTGTKEMLDAGKVATGKAIFRFDTFGDEVFWTDTLHMNDVIQTGVSPKTALAVGLKVDADVLPPGILAKVDLNSPATTVALLKLNAVVGMRGTVTTVNGKDVLKRVGITCALCHSTVDNSAAPGIGHRQDGWPNRDLNVGAIIALSPTLQAPATQAVLKSWGPGKYDAYWNRDGKNNPQMIPPAFGLRGVALETFTGEGPVSYWNAYVAVTQMHGKGSFSDARRGINIKASPDLVTSKLPALRQYQLSIAAPRPASSSFDAAAARRGQAIFKGKAACASCHSSATFTEPAERLHDPAEIGTDPTLALRSATKKYRTTPLRGAWQHPPYFHDGSAATLADVVGFFDRKMRLGLSVQQKSDLTEYLKSL
jgi:mono/diheme cytochrome c family protein